MGGATLKFHYLFQVRIRGVIWAVFIYFFTLVMKLRGVILPILGVNRDSRVTLVYFFTLLLQAAHTPAHIVQR